MTSIIKVNNIQNSSGTAAMTIDGSSNVTFPQNATISGTTTSTGLVTASAGVAIGGTGSANTLEDYEEGSWTPNIGGNATYNNQQGIYTKIGRYVNAHFDITINAIGSGAATILSGFPFAANAGSVTPTMGVYSGHCSYYSDINSNVYSLDMYIINGQTNAYFTGHTAAGGNIGNSLSVFKNSARVVGSVHYFAN